MMTFLELCNRYNVKKAAFSRWLNRHRKEIDPKNQEIQKMGKVLIFSEKAIDKIDKIRNFAVCSDLFAISEPEPEPEAAADQNAAAEKEELKNTIDTLKTQVLLLQNKIIQSQEQTIAAAAALNAATAARLEAAEEKERRNAEINLLRQQIEVKNQELELLRRLVQSSASQRRRSRWWR